MKKQRITLAIITAAFTFLIACNTTKKAQPKNISAADIPIYNKYDDLASLLNSDSDTIYVINYWATWCKPCVEELPYFEQLHSEYKNEKVKVLLVSLDFRNMIETKLVPFINNRNLQPEVVVLADSDANSWIEKVEPEWSGAIPVTIVKRQDKRTFHGDMFSSYQELEKMLKELME